MPIPLSATEAIHPSDVLSASSLILLREASNQSNIAVRDIAYSLVQLFSGPDVTEFLTSEAIDEFLANPIRPSDL